MFPLAKLFHHALVFLPYMLPRLLQIFLFQFFFLSIQELQAIPLLLLDKYLAFALFFFQLPQLFRELYVLLAIKTLLISKMALFLFPILVHYTIGYTQMVNPSMI